MVALGLLPIFIRVWRLRRGRQLLERCGYPVFELFKVDVHGGLLDETGFEFAGGRHVSLVDVSRYAMLFIACTIA